MTTHEESHRRRNPLTGQWILVAAGRSRRPWRGEAVEAQSRDGRRYDPACHLCPGNQRAGGARNPDYDSTFVFTNDFASLRPGTSVQAHAPDAADESWFRYEAEVGTCRVLCFSAHHDAALADMSEAEIAKVVDLWCDQHAELSDDWAWVQLFENRGTAAGASNSHPHGQAWAGSVIPTIVATEDELQWQHYAINGRAMLTGYVEREEALDERVVTRNDDWLVVVPYWAVWPFETLLASRWASSRFSDMSSAERISLAVALKQLLAGYDALFGAPFPYSMGWHPAPGHEPAPHWVLHAHFYPPLLRADARKFMGGYELLAEVQRDITPEEAADRLRHAVRGAGAAGSCP